VTGGAASSSVDSAARTRRPADGLRLSRGRASALRAPQRRGALLYGMRILRHKVAWPPEQTEQSTCVSVAVPGVATCSNGQAARACFRLRIGGKAPGGKYSSTNSSDVHSCGYAPGIPLHSVFL